MAIHLVIRVFNDCNTSEAWQDSRSASLLSSLLFGGDAAPPAVVPLGVLAPPLSGDLSFV
jgi:hypothetical protein